MTSARRTKRGTGRTPVVNELPQHQPSQTEGRQSHPAPACTHGRPVPHPSDVLRVKFTCCLFGAVYKHCNSTFNKNRDIASFACAINTVRSKYPEAFNDDALMESVKAHFISAGTEALLGNTEDHPEACVVFILGYWLAATILFIEKKSLSNCSGLQYQDVLNGCQRALIRFFSKRAPCSCLNTKFAEAKLMPKTGLCAHCNGRRDRSALLICTSCNERQYCSNDCQAKDWSYHQKFCKQRNGDGIDVVGDCRCTWCVNGFTSSFIFYSVIMFVEHCRGEWDWFDLVMLVYSIHCCGKEGALYYLILLYGQKCSRSMTWAWQTYNNILYDGLPPVFSALMPPLPNTDHYMDHYIHFYVLHTLSVTWNQLAIIGWFFCTNGYYGIFYTLTYVAGSLLFLSPKYKEVVATMPLSVVMPCALSVWLVKGLIYPRGVLDKCVVMIWFLYTYGILFGVLYTSAFGLGNELLPFNVLSDLFVLLS